jgi:hypothetical protein
MKFGVPGPTNNGALVAFRVDLRNNTDLSFTGYNGGPDYFSLRRPSLVE